MNNFMMSKRYTNIFQLVSAIAKRHGYIACVYGSSLIKEFPNDLDLMLVPWRKDADWADFFYELQLMQDVEVRVNVEYRGLMNTVSKVLMIYGEQVDIQIREVYDTPFGTE